MKKAMATVVAKQTRIRAHAVLAVIMLVGTAGTVSAMEASTSHQVDIRVERVSMLDVDREWRVQSDDTDADGNRTVTLASTYGVTCNVPGSTIRGGLASSVPAGVQVMVQMASGVGRSTGWHRLTGPSSVDLVHDPRGAEFNQVEVVVEIDGQANPESVNMEFAFNIE
jgi:hypothetical protein